MRAQEEQDCPTCGRLMLVEGRHYDIAPDAVCRCVESLPKNGEEAVVRFAELLRNDDLVGPGFAVRLAVAVNGVSDGAPFTDRERAGVVIGAAAMYRALTGRTG